MLACGGLETPRLLLASRGSRSCGLGNEHDLVGRTYMTHLVSDAQRWHITATPSYRASLASQPDGEVWGTRGLFVAGTAIFPTSGFRAVNHWSRQRIIHGCPKPGHACQPRLLMDRHPFALSQCDGLLVAQARVVRCMADRAQAELRRDPIWPWHAGTRYARQIASSSVSRNRHCTTSRGMPNGSVSLPRSTRESSFGMCSALNSSGYLPSFR